MEAVMDRQMLSISGRFLIGTAWLVVWLAVSGTAFAQDVGTFVPDDDTSSLTRSEVIERQEALARLGYATGPVNGIVGPETVSAAKALAAQLEREFVRRPSGREKVLSCAIEEGAPQALRSIEIMIDEYRGIVIYHYELPGSRGLNPIRTSGNGYVDLSMKIDLNTDELVMASDRSGALVITKRDGRFAKAFVTPVQLSDGSWLAFGHTHSGRCVRSAFD